MSVEAELRRFENKLDEVENKVDDMSKKIAKIELLEERQKDYKEFVEKLSLQMNKLTETIGELAKVVENMKGQRDGSWKVWLAIISIASASIIGGATMLVKHEAALAVLENKKVDR